MYPKSTSPVSFIVDPQRDGVSNALWFEADPTLALSGNKFRFNAASGVVRADVKYGRFEFSVTYPLTTGQTPTNLVNDIEFGLKNLSLGTLGKISVLADKSEDTFTFNTYDICGTAVQSTTITCTDAWGGAVTRFIIEWYNDRIRLLVIDPSATATRVLAEHKTKIGSYPLNPFVTVVGAESFDVDYIVVDNANKNSIMLI